MNTTQTRAAVMAKSALGRRSVTTSYTIRLPNGSRARIPIDRAPSHFGHSTSRVNRPTNEDRYSAGILELPVGSSLTPKSAIQALHRSVRHVFNFAVFDGHGGSECSEFLKQNLGSYVENYSRKSNLPGDVAKLYRDKFMGYWRNWGRSEISRLYSRLTPVDDFQLRIPISFLQADYDYMENNDRAGSTCTSLYLYSNSDAEQEAAFWEPGQVTNLLVAHVGDTRCILCDHNGNARPLTNNHHPSSPVEVDRLWRYATDFFTDSFGEERFTHLANTRAFGDAISKAKGISAEPELIECKLGATGGLEPGTGADNQLVRTFGGHEGFLVLISDGVSTVMSDQELVDLVINIANKGGSGQGTPQEAAEGVVHYAEALGDDNATCLVIRLSGWGDWNWSDRTSLQREDRLRDAIDRPRQRRD